MAFVGRFRLLSSTLVVCAISALVVVVEPVPASPAAQFVVPSAAVSVGGYGSSALSEDGDTEAVLVPELSTQTSVTMQEPDGSFSMYGSMGPINYQDDSGAWIPISNELVDAAGSRYAVKNEANEFATKLPEDASVRPVRLEGDGAWVSMQMEGLSDSAPDVDGPVATFAPDQLDGDVDSVKYQATEVGLKETITLKSAPSGTADLEYVYAIDTSVGLSPTLTAGGAVEFRDAARGSSQVPFVTIPPGVMFDSAVPEPATSDALSYDLATTGTGWELTMTVSLGWLGDPARAYPVVIDPTMNYQDVATRDCWINKTSPTSTYCTDNSQYLRVGRDGTDVRNRALVDFDVSSIPVAATINSAAVNLYLESSESLSSVASEYSLFKAGRTWTNGATWNNSGNGAWATPGGDPTGAALGSLTLTGSSSGFRQFSTGVGDVVQGWVDGSIARRGFVVKQTTEANNNIMYFRSNSSLNTQSNPNSVDDPAGSPRLYRKPFIAITYTLAPNVQRDSTIWNDGGTAAAYHAYTTPIVYYNTVNSTAIPANSTRTVAVAGVSGLPTTGVLGATNTEIRVTGWSGSQAGHASIEDLDDPQSNPQSIGWNVGAGTNSPTSGVTLSVVSITDESGNVAIANNSNSKIQVRLTAKGWFEIPKAASLPNTPPTTGPSNIAIAGSVVRAPGQSNSTRVRVEAWPSQSTLDALSADDEIDMLVLDDVAVAASGAYEVVVPVDDVPAAYLGDRGQVDVEVNVYDDVHIMTQSATVEASAEAATPSVSLNMNLQTATVQTVGNPTATWTSDDGGALTGVEADAAATNFMQENRTVALSEDGTTEVATPILAAPGLAQGAACSQWRKTSTTRDELVVIARIYNWSGAKAKIMEEQSSYHQVGIAYGLKSSSSPTVSWEQSGEKNVSTGTTVSTPSNAYFFNKAQRNLVRYRLYSKSCMVGTYRNYYEYRPEEMRDLLVEDPAPPTVSHNYTYNCEFHRKYDMVKNAGKSYTYSNAVKLEAKTPYGTSTVNLSDQSGWANVLSVQYFVRKPTNICSSDSDKSWLHSREISLSRAN